MSYSLHRGLFRHFLISGVVLPRLGYVCCLDKKAQPEGWTNQIATRETIRGDAVTRFVLLSAESGASNFFVGIDVAIGRLRVIGSSSAINNVLRRPANQILTAFAGQFRQLSAAIGWDLALLLPLLNGLIGDAHLPRHFGERGKVSNSSFECGVFGGFHISCLVKASGTILAQAVLVAQVLLGLAQGFLAGIFPT
jgi:hypothetical protein